MFKSKKWPKTASEALGMLETAATRRAKALRVRRMMLQCATTARARTQKTQSLHANSPLNPAGPPATRGRPRASRHPGYISTAGGEGQHNITAAATQCHLRLARKRREATPAAPARPSLAPRGASRLPANPIVDTGNPTCYSISH